MPFEQGVYISEVPIARYLDRFTLSEANELVPGVRDKVFALLRAQNITEFSRTQGDIIQELARAGITPKDVYISDEDRVGYTVIKKILPLETYMIGVGLHKAANPFGSELLGRQNEDGTVIKRKKRRRGPGNKTGMLWD